MPSNSDERTRFDRGTSLLAVLESTPVCAEPAHEASRVLALADPLLTIGPKQKSADRRRSVVLWNATSLAKTAGSSPQQGRRPDCS